MSPLYAPIICCLQVRYVGLGRNAQYVDERGPVNLKLLDLGRAPYVLYGVKYIDLVSLDGARPVNLKSYTAPPFFQNGAKSGFEMCFDIRSQHFGCWGQNTSRIQSKEVYATLYL